MSHARSAARPGDRGTTNSDGDRHLESTTADRQDGVDSTESTEGSEAVSGVAQRNLLSGFYRASLTARRAKLGALTPLADDAHRILTGEQGLSDEQADHMVENAIGVLGLPLGVCVHLRVDGQSRVAPMAIEEPSVIAAASHGAKLLAAGGGITTSVQPSHMIGQIQLLDVPDPMAAERAILSNLEELLVQANRVSAQLVRRGGGAVDLEVRHLPPVSPADPLGPMMAVHVIVDVLDAMGANLVNTMCEALAPLVAELSGGRSLLRIVSNLADRRLATAEGTVPFDALIGKGADDPTALARRIEAASVFAERDPYRAATHNKGVMNGVDAVLVALGQDWRAVEAGAHAFAARDAHYTALGRWRVTDHGLQGKLELPLSVGVVGGITQVHPTVRAAMTIAGIEDAADLAALAAAVGLAQNLGALRALAAEGIQRGHMRVHARNVAVAAGATGNEVLEVARTIAAGGPQGVKLPAAQRTLRQLRADASAAPTAGDLRQRFAALRDRFEGPIRKLVADVAGATTGLDSSLARMCRYHFDTGGKRLRALLPELVAECLGAEPERLVPFGAACEMLHNATLVHDDLQDGDTTRRGRDSVWYRFGEAQAVNLGDAMFYFTLQLCDRLDVPVARRQAAARRILRETLRVIDGQEREFALKEVGTPTLESYFRMVEGKTSGLFSLPMTGAAELCGARPEVLESLHQAARHIGVLFQVQDDVLDLYADKGRQAQGSDIKEGKRSALAVYALSHCPPAEANWLREVLDRHRDETTDAEVEQAIELFRECGALRFALDEIGRRRTLAVEQVRRADHPALTAMVQGMCDVFLEPIVHLVERIEEQGAPAARDVRLPSDRPVERRVPASEADHEFGRRLLPAVSRTFALSIEALPQALRESVRVAYLLCRVADSFEDAAGIALAERELLMSAFETTMRHDDTDPRLVEQLAASTLRGVPAEELELARNAGAVLRCFRSLDAEVREMVRGPVLTMVGGMRQYAERSHATGGLRLRDMADFERYCYFVAGTVGELLTDLFAHATGLPSGRLRRELDARSVSFGLGLQMVNILKDVAEDAERGVCYVPESVAREHGIELDQLLADERREEALAVVRKLAARARSHLDRAGEYTLLWPLPEGASVRQFCAVPLLLAVLTLDEIEHGDDTLRAERSPKVSREAVVEVVGAVGTAAGDHEALERLLARDGAAPG
ncbi:MAG: hydroxymethylglutaryl-CoA reductase, degradative [Deltaproteobacteria bacterium]|jgi:hydroxymethylglutaryl-CoA reductase|nr:hydroxymethylglutaryl-CoA reductase, degradative [Deltaproteobacteria bacterium]MBW2533173.1 hydroxymethylglutaryl-CoA reductase, degradative [Deltaproteobacteria bacterium]